MIAKLKSHQLRVSVKTALIGVIFVLSLGLVSSGFVGNRKAVAATNSTINFQARVLTSAGALIPDGDYNVEFKIYDTVSSGA